MDVLDKFLKQYSYKFDKGYPDMDNPKDKEMLFEFAYKLTEKKSILNEGEKGYDDRIRFALRLEDDEEIPLCQTPLEVGKNFNLSGEDEKIWDKLFDEKPLSQKEKRSAGAGNGEISAYWAFQHNAKFKYEVQDGRGKDNPDLIINGVGVEVKDYPGSVIKLGKFSADYESVKLLEELFGFKTLLEALVDGTTEIKNANPGKFKPQDVLDAAQLMIDFKNQDVLRQVADQFDFTLIKTMFQKIDGVLKKLNLGQDATQRDIAAGVLKQMSATKLRKKPMLGKEVGYMLNVKKDGIGEFVKITEEIVGNLPTEDVLKHVSVASAEIKMNFDALFN
jgi:hypothetical protein